MSTHLVITEELSKVYWTLLQNEGSAFLYLSVILRPSVLVRPRGIEAANPRFVVKRSCFIAGQATVNSSWQIRNNNKLK